MPNTTNYNWATPADTDLVKDGAAAIRTLGNSIDTTTKNLNPETTTGDIAYRSATANTNTRLAIGSTGQVLTVAAGVPSWATPTTGDIEGVTAGTGISGGGTSGTVTITNSMATAIDAKGDLVAGTGADAFSRLAVGANNTVLTADSAQATGLKWAAASSGAMTLVKRASFSGVATTTTTFDGVFTATYNAYLVIIETMDAVTGADNLELQLRNGGVTKTNNYYDASLSYASGATTASSMTVGGVFTLSLDAVISGHLFFGYGGANIRGMTTNMYGKFGIVQGFVDSYGADGFLLKSSSSNVSGTVAVYGLAIA